MNASPARDDLLNAASGEVDHSLSPEQVIAKVRAALAPYGNVETTKDLLDRYNNLHCPLDGTRAKKQ